MKKPSRWQSKEALIADLKKGVIPLSFSSSNAFDVSPKNLLHYYLHPYSSPAMQESKMIHVAFLEGEEAWNEKYIHCPLAVPFPGSAQASAFSKKVAGFGKKVTDDEILAAYKENYSTKKKSEKKIQDECKDCYDKNFDWIELLIKAGDRRIVLENQYLLSMEVREVLMKDEFVREIMTSKETKVEVPFEDFEIEGVKWKGVLDVLRPGAETMDLKVYRPKEVHPSRFYRVIFNNGLHVQQALYCKAMGIPFEENRSWILAVDKNYRNVNYSLHHIAPDALEFGWEKVIERTKNYKHCRLLNAWEESYGFYTFGRRYFDVHVPYWEVA